LLIENFVRDIDHLKRVLLHCLVR